MSRLESQLVRSLPSLLPTLTVAAAHPPPARGPADLIVEARTPTAKKLRLFVHVRATVAPMQIREAARLLRAAAADWAEGYPVVASGFLSPRIRQICREEQVGYLDLAGNCYLRLGDLYVERIVDRNPFPARGRPATLFSPVSSRILRALLSDIERIWQVQELTKASAASLGQTSKVCRRLIEEEYATRHHGRVRLVQPGRLLDDWRQAYRPAGQRQVYYSFEADLERRMQTLAAAARSRRLRYAVSSLAGASLAAPFVRGVTTLEVYVEQPEIDAWVQALDLRPVEAGANVVFLICDDVGVWQGTQTIQRITVASNLQLYLDASHEPARGAEQAEFLRRERLRF